MFNSKNNQVFESGDMVIFEERQVAEVPIPVQTDSTFEPMIFTRVIQQEIKDSSQ